MKVTFGVFSELHFFSVAIDMHIMLFQGLNFMEGTVFGITMYFAENFRTIVMKRHCHNARDKFSRHYESKIGFLRGQIESKHGKMAENRGTSAAHTSCTGTTYHAYYRKCHPQESSINHVNDVSQLRLKVSLIHDHLS